MDKEREALELPAEVVDLETHLYSKREDTSLIMTRADFRDSNSKLLWPEDVKLRQVKGEGPRGDQIQGVAMKVGVPKLITGHETRVIRRTRVLDTKDQKFKDQAVRIFQQHRQQNEVMLGSLPGDRYVVQKPQAKVYTMDEVKEIFRAQGAE